MASQNLPSLLLLLRGWPEFAWWSFTSFDVIATNGSFMASTLCLCNEWSPCSAPDHYPHRRRAATPDAINHLNSCWGCITPGLLYITCCFLPPHFWEIPTVLCSLMTYIKWFYIINGDSRLSALMTGKTAADNSKSRIIQKCQFSADLYTINHYYRWLSWENVVCYLTKLKFVVKNVLIVLL